MNQNTNPLRQFFRQPAIYMRLPSGGEFWPENSLVMPDNGELPVFPMTAIDEITYRTPDALFNGQAVVDVVQSCVPAIRNAWHIPATDLNAVLVAIRIASYGHEMEVGTTCPKCSTEDIFGLDLRTVLDQMRSADYKKTLLQGDLEISFHPMSYQQQNSSNIEQFENQRMISVIPNSDLSDEEKLARMTEIMKNITRLTVRALTMSIASIRTPQALVTETAHIEEWLTNCDRHVFTAVRDHAIELRTSSELQPVTLECKECSNQYQQQLTLDMSNFFGTAS